MRHWVSSTRAHPPNDNPEDFGWILSEDGSYKVKWFDGHVARAWDSAEDFPESVMIFPE